MKKQNKNWYFYVKSRNLINRIYDMLENFHYFNYDSWDKQSIRDYLKTNIKDICFVETIIKYLEDKLKENMKKVELRCNLSNLIDDLDCLKQYLDT